MFSWQTRLSSARALSLFSLSQGQGQGAVKGRVQSTATPHPCAWRPTSPEERSQVPRHPPMIPSTASSRMCGIAGDGRPDWGSWGSRPQNGAGRGFWKILMNHDRDYRPAILGWHLQQTCRRHWQQADETAEVMLLTETLSPTDPTGRSAPVLVLVVTSGSTMRVRRGPTVRWYRLQFPTR